MSVDVTVYVVLARGEQREDIWVAGVSHSKDGAEALAEEQARLVRAQGITTDRYWVSGPKRVAA